MAEIINSIFDIFKLNGKTAVVTGASRGLGETMALALAEMAFSQSAGVILEITGSYWSLFAIASSAYLIALLFLHV